MKNIKGCRIFYRYLEQLWDAGGQDAAQDWGMLHILGGMQLLSDGSTADPAYESDWDDAVGTCAAPGDAYQIGIQFLKNWQEIGYAEDVARILSDMEAKKRLDLWEKAVQDVEQEQDDLYLRFEDSKIPDGKLGPDMKYVVLIGDQSFSPESFSAVHFPESIEMRRHAGQLEIRYPDLDYIILEEINPDEIRAEYDADELAALPFDAPRWVALKYSNLAHVKRVISDRTFPADVIIDCCNRVSGLEEAFDRNRMTGIPEPENN